MVFVADKFIQIYSKITFCIASRCIIVLLCQHKHGVYLFFLYTTSLHYVQYFLPTQESQIEDRIIILQTIACLEQIDQKNIDQALDYMMIIAVVQVCRKIELNYVKDLPHKTPILYYILWIDVIMISNVVMM